MTVDSAPQRRSLGTAAACQLATTTKSVPQMAGLTPRWLLRMLPWVRVPAGTYRVNRRLSYRVGDGRVSFDATGDRVRVIPDELRELPLLRGFGDPAALRALAERFQPRELAPGETVAARGHRSDRAFLVAHGRLRELGPGEYGAREGAVEGVAGAREGAVEGAAGVREGAVEGAAGDRTVHRVLGPGDHFGDRNLPDPDSRWQRTVEALTPGIVLTLSQPAFDEVVDRFGTLRVHLDRVRAARVPRQNRYGEAALDLAAGHAGEPDLPGTFVDYQAAPRELPLSLAQTVLRVHTRVSDLYHEPMDQVEQQLRLTVAALRERQEHELVNNREFGLLHQADLRQRLHPATGPPTPDDLDRLLSRRRRSHFFLAHPRTVAAFGRECSRRGIHPGTVTVADRPLLAWRGVPILPCDKIPVTGARTSAVLVLRTGEEHHGVVGLHETGLPDEYEPGVSVRRAGVDRKGIASYLVTAYYSAAVLVPDALGVLENVEIGHPWEGQ